MTGPSCPGESPIESYLDELLVMLSGDPRQIRHQLAEAEDHLRQSTAEGVARGLSPQEAESQAVERFGPARPLARAEQRRQARPLAEVIGGCLVSAWWLGAIGAVAVGISGLLAAVGTAVWGQTFTAGRPSRSVLTAANCARWIANTHSATCSKAATADWASDTTLFRLIFGLLGVLVLAAWAWWYRRHRRRLPVGRAAGGLPAVVVDTIAVTCFGAAGVWLAGQSVDTIIVASGRGAGQWLSAAPVALTLAVVFAMRLLRDVRTAET